MKKILILIIILTISITTFIGINHFNNQKNSFEEVTGKISIPVVHMIDKQMVINKLTENLQIVGLEGDIEKEFQYQDSKWFGDKSFTMTLHGNFKMGFNIDDIDIESIVITDDNEIIINTPDITLISLELPYDKIKINKQVDLLRKDFSETDRQLLYSKASESIKQEILNNRTINNDSIVASQNAIKNILLMIPEVKNVSFK